MHRARASQRLEAKAEPIARYARDHGWSVRIEREAVDGWEAIAVSGMRDPWGFVVTFALNPDTGRAVALTIDGKPGAAFVMAHLDDNDDERYWYGPMRAHRLALADPDDWTAR